jgi:DNA/RNA-binding domain of Phe-tRNA-synthetase-like protein
MFQVSYSWKVAYPDSHAGVLVLRGVSNPARHAELEHRKTRLEETLRLQYAGWDRKALLQIPVLKAYDSYYGRFKKTYHVQLQLETILLKGKSIPTVAALVEAMFMAEIKGLLLTAGHDLDSLHLPLTLDAAQGTERYNLLRGEAQTPKASDMLIRDGEGIISSIVYGPDERTRIRPETQNVVFTIYAPYGISVEDVQRQLEDMRDNVLLISPAAKVELLHVFGAD